LRRTIFLGSLATVSLVVAAALAARRVEASHYVLATTLTVAALAPLVALVLWRSMAAQLAISMQCVTMLQAVQAGLLRSLEAKELLLREVHHRVKNNLQVASSLLDLQSRSVGDRLLTQELEVSQNRIRCMALVHESLYGTGQFEHIEARDYLKQLASHLVDSYGRPRSISLHLDLESLRLDVDRAMTVGLLANELLSNALKHAFPEDRSGQVRLRLASKGDACVLTVADDGVGMQPGAQHEKPGCLGMTLVSTFAKQLRGSVAIESDAGTRVQVTFPRASRMQEAVAS
jgi:two-component sensor histidine kinase